MKKIGVALIVSCVLFPGILFANENAEAVATFNLDDLGRVLSLFLVLSVLFETAMTPIFNSRFFLRHFEGKGIKIPLIIVLAFFFFWGYELDIVEELLAAMGHTRPAMVGGKVLTALLIAGGSDGVFRIFTKLGIRNPLERKEKAEQERMRDSQSDEVPAAKK